MGSEEAWSLRYADWGSAQGLAGNISAFINGTARFIGGLGVEDSFAASFVAVVVVSFALTTLDSATRLLRYNIEEISETIGLRVFEDRYVSSGAAVLVIAMFAFYEVEGKPAALALWTLFGTTNQLLAGLTLLVATLYLKQRGRPTVYTGIPCVFILGNTLVAMIENLLEFGQRGQTLLLMVGGALFFIALWILLEGVLTFAIQSL